MVVTSEDRMSCSVHLSEDGRSVVILDQRKLPNREEYLELKTAEEIFEAIRTLAVRGAPAIGICAAYGMYVLALGEGKEDFCSFSSALEQAGAYLISSRPTAVNLTMSSVAPVAFAVSSISLVMLFSGSLTKGCSSRQTSL